MLSSQYTKLLFTKQHIIPASGPLKCPSTIHTTVEDFLHGQPPTLNFTPFVFCILLFWLHFIYLYNTDLVKPHPYFLSSLSGLISICVVHLCPRSLLSLPSLPCIHVQLLWIFLPVIELRWPIAIGYHCHWQQMYVEKWTQRLSLRVFFNSWSPRMCPPSRVIILCQLMVVPKAEAWAYLGGGVLAMSIATCIGI